MRFHAKKTVQISCIAAAALMLSACGTGQNGNQAASNMQYQAENTAETMAETLESGLTDGANRTEEQQETVNVEETVTQTETQDNVSGVTGTYPDGTAPKYSGARIRLTVDGEDVIIGMYDNTAADAFLQRLPMEDISFYDLSGIEKPAETQESFSIGEEEPGYDPVTGEMVIYRPWGNFTIFYGDFRYSDELVPLGKVESGLEILAEKTEDFTGTMELMEE